ncbi:MAG: ABC transporter substrate-binding protein [Phycisphaerales bacterium]|nr:ABC transporter substrate-binding protein [Phycisphaerales bacterium]
MTRCSYGLAAVLTAVSTLAWAEDPIKIGHLASLTGAEANFGQSADHGIAIAVDERNAAGGVLGRKVQVVTVDDQSKNQEVNNCMMKLIQQDKVCAIVGEIASGNTIAAAPAAMRFKIPLVTPGSTNPEVTRKGDYIFRICFTDDFQGKAIAGFTAKTLQAKNAAVITDQAAAYSINLSKTFKEEFEKFGGKVAIEVSYKKTDSDYNAQVNQALQSKPDVLVLTGYYTNVGNIVKVARAAGFTGPCVGGDGWDSDTLYQIGGKALDNCYFTNHYSPEDKDPRIQEFIAKYKSRFGTIPDAMAVLGYDAALVTMDAIQRAGAPEGTKIREALATTKDFKGISGSITIDKDRNAQKGIVVVGIKDAKQYLKEVWKE